MNVIRKKDSIELMLHTDNNINSTLLLKPNVFDLDLSKENSTEILKLCNLIICNTKSNLYDLYVVNKNSFIPIGNSLLVLAKNNTSINGVGIQCDIIVSK